MRAAGPEIALERVSKSFGDARIVDELSVTIEPGQFTVILGPSGCGKSTLLRLIAGLEAVSDGSIRIGGRMANVLPPQERGCGMVFQNYALYPHMTVEGNLAYGLQRAGGSRKAIAGRVAEIAGQLGLGDLLHRRPAQLSGGQRQRVAIGRAIIREPARDRGTRSRAGEPGKAPGDFDRHPPRGDRHRQPRAGRRRDAGARGRSGFASVAVLSLWPEPFGRCEAELK